MSQANHIIQKQILELSLSGKNNNPGLVEKIKNTYYEKTLPQLELLFSELVRGDSVIKLNKLTIDIGSFEEENIEILMPGKILQAVKKELENSLRFEVKDSQNIQILSSGESSVNIFLYFLKQGYLPWWAGQVNLKKLETEIQSNHHSTAAFSASLLKLVKAEANALARLNFQFSAPFKYFLIGKVVVADSDKNWLSGKILPPNDSPTGSQKMPRSNPENTAGPLPATASDQSENFEPVQQKAHLFEGQKEEGQNRLAEKDSAGDDTSSTEKVFGKRANPGEESLEKNPDFSAKELPGKSDHTKKANEDDKKIILKPGTFAREGLSEKNQDPNDVQKMDNPINQVKDIYGQKDREVYTNLENVRTEAGRESIYLDLAGLVIIHPFITRFFEAFDLTQKNHFNSQESLERAVQLLGYLATGENEMEEHVLLLPKFLCGLDFSKPVKKELRIEPGERREMEELLGAVITYWGALKNTSPASLRNTFLQRKGKLSPREGGWQLEVEAKTWDILLHKLPWGISVIRLPWMKEVLYVNWQ